MNAAEFDGGEHSGAPGIVDAVRVLGLEYRYPDGRERSGAST